METNTKAKKRLSHMADSMFYIVHVIACIYIYIKVKNIALSTVDGYSLGLLTDNATKTLFFKTLLTERNIGYKSPGSSS